MVNEKDKTINCPYCNKDLATFFGIIQQKLTTENSMVNIKKRLRETKDEEKKVMFKAIISKLELDKLRLNKKLKNLLLIRS